MKCSAHELKGLKAYLHCGLAKVDNSRGARRRS